MNTIQATQKTKKRIRQLKRDLDLHSDDKVLQMLLSNYKDTSKESIPPIRSKVLDLLSNHEPWSIPDLAEQSCQHVNQDAHTINQFIEAILDTIPNIIKVGDSEYRLAQASID